MFYAAFMLRKKQKNKIANAIVMFTLLAVFFCAITFGVTLRIKLETGFIDNNFLSKKDEKKLSARRIG